MKLLELTSAGATAVLVLTARAAAAEPLTHDGFQFRGATGPGYLANSVALGDERVSFHDVSGTVEVYIGGTPVRGLAIGGFLDATVETNPNVTVERAPGRLNTNIDMNYFTIGAYADFYPNRKAGFHFLGAVGWAELDFGNQAGYRAENATGFSLGAGVGYDFWVWDEWSIGVLGRFTYSSMTFTDHGDNGTEKTVNPTLAFSCAYQ